MSEPEVIEVIDLTELSDAEVTSTVGPDSTTAATPSKEGAGAGATTGDDQAAERSLKRPSRVVARCTPEKKPRVGTVRMRASNADEEKARRKETTAARMKALAERMTKDQDDQ